MDAKLIRETSVNFQGLLIALIEKGVLTEEDFMAARKKSESLFDFVTSHAASNDEKDLAKAWDAGLTEVFGPAR